jgi:hypothetical protein
MTRPRATTSQADALGATIADMKARLSSVELLAHTPCGGGSSCPCPENVLLAGDTMTGFLTLHSNPTSDLHATTKQYVDIRDSARVLKAGDTMSGTLFITGGNLTMTGGSISTDGNISLTGNATRITQNNTATWSGNAGTGFGKIEYHSNTWYINAGSNSTEVARFRRGASDVAWINNSGGIQAYSMQGTSNVAGTGNAIYAPSGVYSTGTNWLYGLLYMNQNNLGGSTSSSLGAGEIYASSWFRSWGISGWYNQTYAGGWFMQDTTWIRSYGSRRVYMPDGIGGAVQYGSYGSITCYGTTNGYAGTVYPDTASTTMVRNDLFGHYINNNAWNFYIQFGGYYPSDARWKREITPLEHGTEFLKKIQPVTYRRISENAGDPPETLRPETHFGFTTQQLLEAIEASGETRDVAMVSIGGPTNPDDTMERSDRQYLNAEELIAPIIKAIQELDARIETLEAEQA